MFKMCSIDKQVRNKQNGHPNVILTVLPNYVKQCFNLIFHIESLHEMDSKTALVIFAHLVDLFECGLLEGTEALAEFAG